MMKIGKLILNDDGTTQEVLNETTYATSAEAVEAAKTLKAQNESNDTVLHILVAEEITDVEYKAVIYL